MSPPSTSGFSDKRKTWRPGIADKFTQSAQGRLLRPGMTATLNALLRGGFEVHGSFRERGQSLIRLPLLLQGLIQQANRIIDAAEAPIASACRIARFTRVGGLRHLRQRLQNLLFGVVDILQRIEEEVVEVFVFRGHGALRWREQTGEARGLN